MPISPASSPSSLPLPTLEQIRAQREVGQDATLEDVFLKLVAADVRREDLSWIG